MSRGHAGSVDTEARATYVAEHVPDQVLSRRYGPADDVSDRMALFTEHRRELSQAAARRMRAEGPQIVLVRLADLD